MPRKPPSWARVCEPRSAITPVPYSRALSPFAWLIPSAWYTSQCPVAPRYSSAAPAIAAAPPGSSRRLSAYAASAPPAAIDNQRSTRPTFTRSEYFVAATATFVPPLRGPKGPHLRLVAAHLQVGPNSEREHAACPSSHTLIASCS